jgi:enoyl-CoA hydratase/carnithine racemase
MNSRALQPHCDQHIKVERIDRVVFVTMDRPESKNALTKSMYAAIRDACLHADNDPDVDVLVLRGSSGSFAVGGDLKEILAILEGDEPTAVLDYEEFLPFEAVRSMRKPTVALIDGLCLGGGLTLALMCDISIASERSRFAIPEAKVGIVDGHLPRLLREAVPPAKLRYWMYTGNLFPAAEASAAGLVSLLAPESKLDEVLQKCLRDLGASSPGAIRTLKRVLNETRPLSSMTDACLTLLQPAVLKRLQAFGNRDSRR